MDFLKKIKLSTLAILLVALACFIIDLSLKNWEKQDRVIEHDIHWYYAYLPSAFIYDDIKEEKSDYRFDDNYYLYWPLVTADGKKITKTTCGLAILYSPFFFAAHAYATISDYPENGFSEPYKIFLLLSAIFYLVLGLDFIRKVLRHYGFSDNHIAITVLLLGLGTNLLCYSSQSAPMSHVYNFFLFAVFIHYTIKWHQSSSIKNTIIIGLLLGLISLIRPSNVIIFLFFALYNVSDMASFRERMAFFRKECFLLNLIALFALLVWVPQFLYWKEVTGNYLFYSYTDEGFFFSHPRIMEGLFSFRKGWLVYTPMMIFPLIGLFFRDRLLNGLRFPVVLFMLLNIYIIFSWWCWWYGGTFGQRSMIESYALLAIPFALVIRRVAESRLWMRIASGSVCLFLIWLNIFQTYQYEALTLHWEGMTKELYFKQFGKLDKIKDYDQYVSWANYDEAKKGNSCETPAVDTSQSIKDYNGRKEVQRSMISLQAANGKFLCADEGLKLNVVATKDKASTWETFTLVMFGNNECALRCHKNFFFSTELNHEKEITATREAIGTWEIFSLVELGDGLVAFRATNGKYLSLEDGSSRIVAKADNIAEKEKFRLIKQ
ncbi:MAG: hypothetical protein JWO09_1930 [Bacteroidetes bacterium]|nr:hypothetical protein [Bacteroidota bacterium]